MPRKVSLAASYEDFRQTGSRLPPKDIPKTMPVVGKKESLVDGIERVKSAQAIEYLLTDMKITRISISSLAEVSEMVIDRARDVRKNLRTEELKKIMAALELEQDEFFMLGAKNLSEPNKCKLVKKIMNKAGEFGLRFRTNSPYRRKNTGRS